MMCDNLSLYKTYISSSTTQLTTMPPQFYSINDNNDHNEHRPYMGIKRKLSDYEDHQNSSLTSLTIPEHLSTSFQCAGDDDEGDDDDDDGNDEGSSDDDDDEDDDERISDDETNNIHPTTPCTITQRRHSDTIQTSFSSPIVKRRCTYSSMHDDEQKRSVLVESYRKLRGVKKPKLQVSLLICNLIKRLEKTFTKTPPLPRLQQQQQELQQQLQQQQMQHVQYYQHRTTYRSSSSDSIYMSSSLVNDDIETTTLTPINQQYSPPHSSNYDSDKVLLPVGDLRTSHSMYHPTTTDPYWLAQSNFAIPVVSTSDEDDVDVSLQGGGEYLDLTDNTLAPSFSNCLSSSSSSSSPSISSSELISNDCCCSSSSSITTTVTSPTLTKVLVDTNNNTNDDYYIYHHHHHHSQLHSNEHLHSHHHTSTSDQTFFYHHNGSNTVDLITTA